MPSANTDTDTSVVTTYVPAYQKEIWQSHAANLGMSQSEFVKTMVQAGRRTFEDTEEPENAKDGSPTSDPQGSSGNEGDIDDLERAVLSALEADPYLTWDELVDTVIGGLEAELEETLTDLQRDNRITHSPRRGGYVLTEDS